MLSVDTPRVKSKIFYRADVDVLRAIAVFAVIFYHYNLFSISGGYVGVDIFFVISGYLITEIINQEYFTNTFSFKSFFIKRYKRLFPAYILMISIVYIVGWGVFTPHRFQQLSLDSLSAICGLSNITYWLQTGYFDALALQKPLLHTWTLAVEFQFYFFWSIFIIFLLKFQRIKIFYAILSVLIVSLSLSCFVMYEDKVAAFYLFPLRLWEFCIGGLVVYLPKLNKEKNLYNTFIFVISLFLIVLPMFLYNGNSYFPGYFALVPTLGAAGYIYSGSPNIFSIIFENKTLGYLGKLSYSLYLIHWPLLVFAKNIIGDDVSSQYLYLTMLLCFIYSFACFNFVEKHFKLNQGLGLNAVKIHMAVILTLLAILTYNFYTKGIKAYHSSENLIIKQANLYDLSKAGDYLWSSYSEMERKESFETNKPHLLIIGDSQSADLLNILNAAGISKYYEIITRSVWWECGALFIEENERQNFFKHNKLIGGNLKLAHDCSSRMNRLFESKVIYEADIIVSAFLWLKRYSDRIDRAFEEIERKSKANHYAVGRKDLLVSSIDLLNDFGYEEIAKQMAYKTRTSDAIEINNQLKKKMRGRFIDIYGLFCSDQIKMCEVIVDDNSPVLIDRTHFSKNAAMYFAKNKIYDLFPFLFTNH